MKMMEALAARLKEPPLSDSPVEQVDLRFSPSAVRELVHELEVACYMVWPADKKTFICQDMKGDRGFLFSVDQSLPGKSFVVSLRK